MLDLNNSSSKLIKDMTGVDNKTVNSISQYRKYRKFRNVDDLWKLDGMTKTKYNAIVRHCKISGSMKNVASCRFGYQPASKGLSSSNLDLIRKLKSNEENKYKVATKKSFSTGTVKDYTCNGEKQSDSWVCSTKDKGGKAYFVSTKDTSHLNGNNNQRKKSLSHPQTSELSPNNVGISNSQSQANPENVIYKLAQRSRQKSAPSSYRPLGKVRRENSNSNLLIHRQKTPLMTIRNAEKKERHIDFHFPEDVPKKTTQKKTKTECTPLVSVSCTQLFSGTMEGTDSGVGTTSANSELSEENVYYFEKQLAKISGRLDKDEIISKWVLTVNKDRNLESQYNKKSSKKRMGKSKEAAEIMKKLNRDNCMSTASILKNTQKSSDPKKNSSWTLVEENSRSAGLEHSRNKENDCKMSHRKVTWADTTYESTRVPQSKQQLQAGKRQWRH